MEFGSVEAAEAAGYKLGECTITRTDERAAALYVYTTRRNGRPRAYELCSPTKTLNGLAADRLRIKRVLSRSADDRVWPHERML